MVSAPFGNETDFLKRVRVRLLHEEERAEFDRLTATVAIRSRTTPARPSAKNQANQPRGNSETAKITENPFDAPGRGL